MQSSNKWSEKRKRTITKALKRSWSDGGAHREATTNQHIDADTARKRALWDRKGNAAATLALTGVQFPYFITYSHRRTDSYDVWNGGSVVCTGGKAKVGLFLGSKLP